MEAKGRFVGTFSMMEGMLRYVLQVTVGIDDQTQKAVFSGVRTDQAIRFVKRCYEARGKPLPPAAQVMSGQASYPSITANDLLPGVDFESVTHFSTMRIGP